MHLEGSCHCRKVRFSVDAAEPVPFMFDAYPDMSLAHWHEAKGLRDEVDSE